MSKRPLVWPAMACCFLACEFLAPAESQHTKNLDRQFQSAVAHYDAGEFREAAVQLEDLVPRLPDNSQVHELLGLVYEQMGQDTKAIEHLNAAARLKPDWGAARTNLAAALSHTGNRDQAGIEFRKALELEPQDFNANHNLGEFYIQSGKVVDAQPLLERAQKIDPSSYDNGYDLAMADLLTDRLDDAGQMVQNLLRTKNTGELHNLLGQIDEKAERFVEAANEFQIAAHMDPTDENLFAWGTELLLHRAYEPAIDVFREAVRRYPSSPRMEIGLGMALYWRDKYEDSVKALLAAADLDPTDARCYLFLSKAYNNSPNQTKDVIERFRRYAELEPDNALAQYYYAMSLWKGKRAEDSGVNLCAIEALLKKAIELNGALSEPHVQLGNLYADQHQYEKSIPEYERALALNQNLPDAHFRLGTDYVHTGQKDRAKGEFDMYQKLRAQHMAKEDKEKAEVQQFVYSSKPSPLAKP